MMDTWAIEERVKLLVLGLNESHRRLMRAIRKSRTTHRKREMWRKLEANRG
jgi:hypothetical protein